MHKSALYRSRRELSNEYLLAKFGFDTAENEPSKVCPIDQLELSAGGPHLGVNRLNKCRSGDKGTYHGSLHMIVSTVTIDSGSQKSSSTGAAAENRSKTNASH